MFFKPNVEKKIKSCFLTRLFKVGSVQNKTSFVSFRVRPVNGKKNIIQKKQATYFKYNIYKNFKPDK